MLATTQPDCGVFFWDKAERRQALGFGFVGAITERLKDKDVIREYTGYALQTRAINDDFSGGFTCFLLCPQVHHE